MRNYIALKLKSHIINNNLHRIAIIPVNIIRMRVFCVLVEQELPRLNKACKFRSCPLICRRFLSAREDKPLRVYALSVFYAAVAEQLAALGGTQAAAQSYLRCRRIAARFLSYQPARYARALQVYFKADI